MASLETDLFLTRRKWPPSNEIQTGTFRAGAGDMALKGNQHNTLCKTHYQARDRGSGHSRSKWVPSDKVTHRLRACERKAPTMRACYVLGSKKVLPTGFQSTRGADARSGSFPPRYSYCFYSDDSHRLHLLLMWCRKLSHRPKPPPWGFLLGGCMLATRYKTRYRWLHGGYMTHKTKNPATD